MSDTSQPVASRQIFCATCVGQSTDQTPGDVSTLNGIGRQFYGSAAPCPECASVIRTLWWTLISAPIIPLGSYRYKTSSEAGMRARFWCRKLPRRAIGRRSGKPGASACSASSPRASPPIFTKPTNNRDAS